MKLNSTNTFQQHQKYIIAQITSSPLLNAFEFQLKKVRYGNLIAAKLAQELILSLVASDSKERKPLDTVAY